MLGYDKADFWTKELFNVLSFSHAFDHVKNIYYNSSAGAVVIALSSLGLLVLWEKKASKKLSFIPSSFVVVVFGVLMALLFEHFVPFLALKPSQFVYVPGELVFRDQVAGLSCCLHTCICLEKCSRYLLWSLPLSPY